MAFSSFLGAESVFSLAHPGMLLGQQLVRGGSSGLGETLSVGGGKMVLFQDGVVWKQGLDRDTGWSLRAPLFLSHHHCLLPWGPNPNFIRTWAQCSLAHSCSFME